MKMKKHEACFYLNNIMKEKRDNLKRYQEWANETTVRNNQTG